MFGLPSTVWQITFKDGSTTEIIADGPKELIKKDEEKRAGKEIAEIKEVE